MSNTVTLNLKFSTNASTTVSQIRTDLRNLGNTAQNEARRIQDSFNGIRGVLQNVFGAAIGAGIVTGLARIADAAANNAAKLRIVTQTAQEFAVAQADVLRIAQQTGAALGATTDLYSKLAISLERLNPSQAQLATVTQTVTQALLVSGATVQGAAGALTQLGQAFNSGVLRGQEFNSVAEQAPRLLRAIADEMGVPVQALRGLAREGKITSEVLFKAFTGEGAAKIAAEAANIPITTARAFQQLQNTLERYVANADKATGASQLLVGAIGFIERNLSTLVPILAGGAFVAFAATVGRTAQSFVSLITGFSETRAAAIQTANANLTLAASEANAARQGLLLAETNAILARNTLGAAAATANLARAQLAATAASAELAAAQVAANAASAGFGASLLALAGGPIGAVILGLTAAYVAIQAFKSEATKAAEANTAALQTETAEINRQIEALRDQRRAIEGSRPDNLSKLEKEQESLTKVNIETARYVSLAVEQGNVFGLILAAYSEFKALEHEKTIEGITNAQAELKAQTEALATAQFEQAAAFNFADEAARRYKAGIDSLLGSEKDLNKEYDRRIKAQTNRLIVAQGGDPFEVELRQQITALEQAGKSTEDAARQLQFYIQVRDLATEAEKANSAAAKGTRAANSEAKQAEDERAEGLRQLTKIARDLAAQFSGPSKVADERLADAIDKINDAYNQAVKGAKNLSQIESARKIQTQALADAEREHAASIEQITRAQEEADKAVREYVGASERELRNLELTREERRINEAGLRAEAELRAKISEAIKNNTGDYANLTAAQIDNLVRVKVETERAAEAQNIVAEAGRRAAEEYRRQWEQAFDSVVDAALQGGDALKSAVFRYLRDIQAEFAKKIILNIVTRYSSEGKKGKAGQSDDDEEPTLFEQGVQFAAGAAGVRDAYRNGGGAGGALSGAVSGYQAGSVFGPVGGIIGAIVGGIAGLIGGPKPPDLRLGASGVTRKPEQSFNTVFGAQQIGVRGGTDTARFIELVTEFDKTISGIVGNFENGQDQLDAIKNRLRTWSVDLKGDAITTEAVLGSRFNAILSTFNADIQAFVGTLGTTEERAQRLQDAAFIQAATKGSILANTFNDLARILGDNAKNGESVAQTYERVSASVETLRAALAISGVQLTQTGDVFIRFAADIATAAGGTQQAAELWNTYFETFYTAEERAASAVEVANQRRLDALNAIGLEATISAEQFRATFEAALPTLTPEQVAAYLQAGTAIARAAAAQDAYNEVLDEAGALTAQAQAAAEALNQVEQSLAQIEQRIDAGFTELARSGFTDFERSLLSINDTLGATTRELLNQRSAAELAGASAQTLARFDLALGRAQLLAASQAAAAIDRLRKAARSLIDQLYGTGVQEVADAGAAAFEQIGQAAQNMYETQLNSIKTIQDYLDAQLLGQNSSLTPSERFEEAQRQFFAAIASGNAQESVRLADVLLNLGRERFASSQPFNDLEAAVRAALQGLIGTIGTPVAPTGTGFGSTGTPQEFDQAARENRLELALQLSEIVRELLLATGDSLSTVAESIGLNMTQLVTDLGINLGSLNVATTTSLANIAGNLGIELSELARNVGVDLGQLSADQSLINAALEAEIKKLPKDQRDKLQPLLDAVEEAARVGGPEEINKAIKTLEDATKGVGGAAATALAPFLDGIDPTDPLLEIDSAVRELWRPGSYLDQINANIAELLRITTLPQPEAPAAVIATTTTPGRAQASTITIVPDNTALISEIKKTNERLVALENTVRNGDRANVNATNTAAAVVANSSEKIASKPKLVMSEYA